MSLPGTARALRRSWANASALRDGAGKVIGGIGILRDLRARAYAESLISIEIPRNLYEQALNVFEWRARSRGGMPMKCARLRPPDIACPKRDRAGLAETRPE